MKLCPNRYPLHFVHWLFFLNMSIIKESCHRKSVTKRCGICFIQCLRRGKRCGRTSCGCFAMTTCLVPDWEKPRCSGAIASLLPGVHEGMAEKAGTASDPSIHYLMRLFSLSQLTSGARRGAPWIGWSALDSRWITSQRKVWRLDLK